MKKLLSLAVIALVALSMAACAPTPTTPAEGKGTVVIGTPAFSGNLIGGFGNNAYDVIVRNMIWGYATYTTTIGGEIVLDPTVVKTVTTAVNDAGDKTYTFELNTNLKWSDGTAITADDYVFALLFASSPQWRLAGASDTTGRELVGYSAYNKGEATVFEGVKKLGTHSFSVTISNDYLPYFYETLYAAVSPVPLHVWGQGVTIGEDGSSLVGDVTAAATYVAGTERFAPSVTSGPFKFVSNIDKRMTVKFNPEYVGDYRGVKAKLDTVIVQEVNQDLDVDLVIAGEVDIVTGVIQDAKIKKAIVSDQVDLINYKRNGYGFIGFTTDFGPTKDLNYRKAVAHLIDRQQFVTTILGGYGAMVNAEYGLAQWMYDAKAAELNENLINYVVNVDEANRLLDLTEWKFEADGVTPWDKTKATAGYWRHNDKGEVLKHNHFGSTNNPISDLINTEWPKGMNQAGIQFYLEYGDFSALLSNYYVEDPENRFFNSYNLAVNFSVAYDPYYSLHSDFYGQYSQNPTGTNDPEIDRLTVAMRSLEPTQKDEYLELWYEYQLYWNSQLLPQLPLYSNVYFDIFNKRVVGLQTNPLWTVGRAIIDVSVAD
ncbi:MAG: ABC transporter substrate-binding protein [Erysipelotrichia bacterium]|jgi:peptide/nickel transport system substrate-binding protein|nr:ABC transporter substrate-binding protein [Erysipelotrichia bacterium]